MSSLAKDTQWVDAIDQAEMIRSGNVSPLELLDAAIERAEQLNPAINALTYTWYERAREMAKKLPNSSSMPLRGVLLPRPTKSVGHFDPHFVRRIPPA